MIPNRRTIGQILVDLGQIDDSDVERALHYQREHGGYFGEALLALELVSPEALGWTLADQFDLPFVRLHPEEVDLEAARMVEVGWARERNALPILRSGERITVVLSDPTQSGEIGRELRARLGVDQIEMALAPHRDITELIDAAFGVRSVPVDEWLRDSRSLGTGRFGISVRKARAVGWVDSPSETPVPLDAGWRATLQRIVRPFPDLRVGEVNRWRAEIDIPGDSLYAECTALRGSESFDWAARPLTEAPVPSPIIRDDLVERVRRLRADRSRVILDLGGRAGVAPHEVVALATTLLESSERIFVVSDRPTEPLGAPVVRLDQASDAGSLDMLEDFSPEALVVIAEELGSDRIERMAAISPLLLLCVDDSSIDADLSLVLVETGDGRQWQPQHQEGHDGAD